MGGIALKRVGFWGILFAVDRRSNIEYRSHGEQRNKFFVGAAASSVQTTSCCPGNPEPCPPNIHHLLQFSSSPYLHPQIVDDNKPNGRLDLPRVPGIDQGNVEIPHDLPTSARIHR